MIPFPMETAKTVYTPVYGITGGGDLKEIYTQHLNEIPFDDPTEHLPLAMAKDYGDYQPRKDQLLGKGRAWFKKLALGWQGEERISEAKLKDVGVQICDGRTSQEGSTFIRFTEPMFHGIEFDRVGWVIVYDHHLLRDVRE